MSTSITVAASNNEEMAFTVGLTPRRIWPQITTGTVLSPPVVNSVTMNSSSDSAKASRPPPITDGRMSGNVTDVNVRHGERRRDHGPPPRPPGRTWRTGR